MAAHESDAVAVARSQSLAHGATRHESVNDELDEGGLRRAWKQSGLSRSRSGHGKMLFKLATAYRKRSDISAQGDEDRRLLALVKDEHKMLNWLHKQSLLSHRKGIETPAKYKLQPSSSNIKTGGPVAHAHVGIDNTAVAGSTSHPPWPGDHMMQYPVAQHGYYGDEGWHPTQEEGFYVQDPGYGQKGGKGDGFRYDSMLAPGKGSQMWPVKGKGKGSTRANEFVIQEGYARRSSAPKGACREFWNPRRSGACSAGRCAGRC